MLYAHKRKSVRSASDHTYISILQHQLEQAQNKNTELLTLNNEQKDHVLHLAQHFESANINSDTTITEQNDVISKLKHDINVSEINSICEKHE